jgi:hypothetical protein
MGQAREDQHDNQRRREGRAVGLRDRPVRLYRRGRRHDGSGVAVTIWLKWQASNLHLGGRWPLAFPIKLDFLFG